MRYLVDTNVISEVMKASPSESVLNWLKLHEYDLFLSVVTVEELRFGELMMSQGKRKKKLHEMIDFVLEKYASRILIFDAVSAELCAEYHNQAIKSGRTPTFEDLMIAAIATTNECVLVTRNVRNFNYLGIELFNPFED